MHSPETRQRPCSPDWQRLRLEANNRTPTPHCRNASTRLQLMQRVREVVPQCASVWFERVKRHGSRSAARIFGGLARYRNDVETPRIVPRRGDAQDTRAAGREQREPLGLPAWHRPRNGNACRATLRTCCIVACSSGPRASLYKAARRQKECFSAS